MSQVINQVVASFTHTDFYVLLLMLGIALLVKYNRFPTTEAIRRFTSMLDDRGGNILVLGVFTGWFVYMTVRLFYYTFSEMDAGRIKPDNAILLLALNTMSGTFAGTCFGALLKTMSGSMTVAPPNASTSGGMQLPAGAPYPSLASPSIAVGRPGTDVHIDSMQEGHFGG